MIFGMTYYQIASFFIFYAFLGWILEVVYHAVGKGQIVNRGFLCGPVCPVYGFGAVGVLMLVNGLEKSGIVSTLSAKGTEAIQRTAAVGEGSQSGELIGLLLLFVLGVVLATLIELIAGWMLDMLFHARWWDYSNQPLNFHGYICLSFSLIWGLAVVFVIRVVHPLVENASTQKIPERYGYPVLAVLYVIFLADLIVTVAEVRGLNKKLAELDKLRSAMRVPSDVLTDKIGGTSLKTAQAVGENRVQAALLKAELRDTANEKKKVIGQGASAKKAAITAEAGKRKQALMDQYQALRGKLMKHSFFGTGRLLRAFPGMVHRDYKEVISALQSAMSGASNDNRQDGK